MQHLAKFISIFFHPLILVYLLVFLTYRLDPFNYYINDKKTIGALFIMNFVLLVVLPMIGIAMLRGLKMIPDISMPKREDRIGPLIITLAFYIWFFINIYNNVSFPDTLRFAALGITLTCGIIFFINNFSKPSLHAAGAGSFIMCLALLIFTTKSPMITLFGDLQISSIFAFFISIFVAGAIGTSRLYLKAHSPQEVFGGFSAGVLAQIIAFRIIM